MPVAIGTRIGPYEVVGPLGAGGMGEVYRARDVRLGREVALKVLPARFAESPVRLARLGREARVLAALNHPHIATLYGFEESGRTPALVMELVEGASLAARLEGGALPLEEAVELARQIAEALEAAHEKGILHRDLKPANVRLTAKGQVKLLDFGLAKALQPSEEEAAAEAPPSTLTTEQSPVSSGTGIAGTAPYMSPEQARGEELDRRSDLWAFGCVLFEMLTGRRAFPGRSFAETVASVIDREPEWGALPAGTPPALVRLLERCLRKDREDRLRDAGDARLELEDLLGRRRGRPRTEEQERSPYPGLRAFGEEDSGVFFGREREVVELWGKLRERRLVAVIGPSGAGKTSFLRAGVIPTRPRGWQAVCATPGTNPALGLARALTPELAGDAEAMGELLSGVEALRQTGDAQGLVSAAKRWRGRGAEALLVVDQLEELFTLNPPEAQASFAALLGRLAGEADVHVVLSLRDDFLMRCCEQPSLAPILTQLTALLSLGPEALRRALVEPAEKRGYRFEDDALVGEMVEAVEGARAPLPLLAFAVSRLWEKRDPERRLLTREAYQEVGGVAGALAQHAEATLERIGSERQGLVRELFRNLVTAQGTRAVIDRGELLSVFATPAARGAGAGAEEVLGALVDARLLTSYERAGESGESHQQVEIIHESLLSAWPRLVRWQTQDADGAQLRDQLRQAAQLWQDRGRSPDLLWAGQTYRDFALWRERSPVPLTATEDAFARAMTASANRRRRQRRAAGLAVVATAVSVAIVTSVLWKQADASRREAEAETRHAEATKLLALGQLERESYPSAALAWAIRSLETADSPQARLFALGILQAFPVAILAPAPADDLFGLASNHPVFSPDGQWLAVGGYRRALLLNRDGRPALAMGDYPGAGFKSLILAFGSHGDRLIADRVGDLRAWSIPDGRELWRRKGPPGFGTPYPAEDGFLTTTRTPNRFLLHAWPPDDGDPRLVGSSDHVGGFDVHGSRVAYRLGRRILVRSIDDWNEPPVVFGELPAGSRGGDVVISPDGRRVAASDGLGGVRVWARSGAGIRLLRTLHAPDSPSLAIDEQGRRLLAFGVPKVGVIGHIFDLDAPPGAEPLILRRSDIPFFHAAAFDPSGRWLATANSDATSLWALDGPRPLVLGDGEGWKVQQVVFAPDSQTLLASGPRGLKEWALGRDAVEPSRVLLAPTPAFPGVALDPTGHRAVVAGGRGRVTVVPVSGGPTRELEGFSKEAQLSSVVLAEGGRFVAAAPFNSPRAEKLIRVWDLESGAARDLRPVPGAGKDFSGGILSLWMAGRHHVVAGVTGYGLLRFDLRDGSHELLASGLDLALAVSPDGRSVVACANDPGNAKCTPTRLDVGTHVAVPLTTHGDACAAAALDPAARLIVTGSYDGVVRIGLASGEEPHVFLGHRGFVRSVAFSPDGRWVASGGEDGAIRLWPVPDVTKPPLHTRPLEEMLAVLRTHTNLRAVPDPQSATGYRLAPGPFSGWAKAPEW